MEQKVDGIINELNPNMIKCEVCGKWIHLSNKKHIIIVDWKETEYTNSIMMSCWSCYQKSRHKLSNNT